MKGFRYKHGDRPLDGYTIQRAAGRGGFGEVYYAVSDGGRQVALKAVQGYEQIELRGISQCMNLKSPHLVTIFDVRRNAEGEPFVIMEFVTGPSLRELIDEHPGGVGTQKAAFFLREIAKGLSYLHDCGIVHRDLKPGNIFYEDGYVKIGDYGLSKAMTGSLHSGQTITVGTVHYMAPEIGQGRYDRSIDIYAMGAILYEMLTGQTPFLGSSAGEILMKHLSTPPDVSGIEQPFARVIEKAMAKDPGERYATVQAMVEDVFGSESVRESVSVFSPQDLSMVAGRVAGKVRGAGEGGGETDGGEGHQERVSPPPPPPPGGGGRGERARGNADSGGRAAGERVGDWGEHFGERMGEWGAKFGKRMAEVGSEISRQVGEEVQAAIRVAKAGHHGERADDRPGLAVMPVAIGVGSRVTVALGTGVILSVGAALASGSEAFGAVVWFAMLASGGGVAGLAAANGIRVRDPKRIGRVRRRLMYALCATLGVLFLSIFVAEHGTGPVQFLKPTYWAIIIPLFVLHWPRILKADRARRLVLRPVVFGGLLALLIGSLNDGSGMLAGGVVATIALASQTLADWRPARRVASGQGAPNVNDLGAGQAKPPKRGKYTTAYGNYLTGEGPVYTSIRVDDEDEDVLAKVPPAVSPCKRWWALLLTLGHFMGISGLHRFYTGHIVSGVIWFLTWGLFGIGQLVDALLIVTGNFKDKTGRTLVVWHSFDELRFDERYAEVGGTGEPRMPAETPSKLSMSRHTEAKHAPLMGLAGLLMLVGLAVGLGAALNVPALVASGVAGDSVRQELDGFFGYSAWPPILEQTGYIASALMLLSAASLMMIARRESGVLHMFRAATGFALFGVVIGLVKDFTRYMNWDRAMAYLSDNRLGPAIEALGDGAHRDSAIGAVLVMGMAVFVLAWPHRKREPVGSAALATANGGSSGEKEGGA